MKFLNKESRHPIYLNTDIPAWQKDYTMQEKVSDIRLMGNVQLSQIKEVAEFNRLEIQLRIYSLKKAGKKYEGETFLLKLIENQIKDISEHIKFNAKDNRWHMTFEEE
jgi:hypothetical protein